MVTKRMRYSVPSALIIEDVRRYRKTYLAAIRYCSVRTCRAKVFSISQAQQKTAKKRTERLHITIFL